MEYNLTSHFYVKPWRKNTSRDVPIYLRVTLNGKRIEFSTNQWVNEENNRIMKLEIGNKFTRRTVDSYENSLNRLKEFIQNEYKISDLPLERLNYQFVQRYSIYLRSTYENHHNTIMRYVKQLKRVIHQAIAYGYLDKDPFTEFRTTYQDPNRAFLTQEDLNKLENKEFKIDRLRIVRNIFLFMCYPGLSYSDLAKLTPSDISIGIDGEKWIISERNKTGVRFSVPLLPKALEILNRYSDHPECSVKGTILPMRSNQKLNSYLEEIADLCGIEKNLTCHITRHTFATTVTLTNGVPIETISKMLGHTNLQTTQIYSKVIDQKIAEDMGALKKKMAV